MDKGTGFGRCLFSLYSCIFRHSTATTMAQAGVPIQDVAHVLGHVNVSTTMIYAEVSEANVKAEHKRHVV